ncbi:MAG: hypothetical protein KIS73_27035 [Enhydrobacter sp.]|nr:hypothetical protein [Enhydrobacter sp.]
MAEESATTTTTDATQATGTATPTPETKAAETTQSTETKGAEETKATETKAEETKAAPVDYGKVISEVQMPEGMTLDPKVVEGWVPLLSKHNLSADAVKDLAAQFAAQQKAGADGNAKAFADQVGAWKSDAEKTTTAEERGTAKDAALKVFGKDELALLEHFGVTNRAGFIKALAKVGKAIKDDPFVPGNAAGNGARDARAHFPNSNMNL